MAPNKDWYWDQFDVDVIQSIHPFRKQPDKLDLSDAQTVGLEGLTDQQRVDYETDFIDELYGTENRAWETRKGEALDEGGPTDAMYRDNTTNQSFMTNQAEIGAMGSTYRGANADQHVLWGLDLRRVDNEALEIGSNEHYQHLTRGQVDWAYYEKDPAYIKAFERANIDYDVDATAQDKVDWIREANETIGQGDDDKDNREPPTGEYDADKIRTETDTEGNTQLFINGERQPTLSERYNTIDPETGERSGRLEIGFTTTRKDEDGNDVEYTVGPKGKLSESAFDPVAGPPTPVVKPQINIPNVKVKVPASLSQWKTHAKQTLKVGGKK